MRAPTSLRLISVLVVLLPALQAQGPDVIVGELNGIDAYGGVGPTYAYAIGTTACNVGTAPVAWQGGTNAHPVIAQNMYRLKNGRFEQIGLSWLKHGFVAAGGSLCGTCQGGGGGLGVGCSDPYGASLNGSQFSLGPRNEVNATTGFFPYPIAGSYPPAGSILDRRIQCQGNDVNPALNAGAVYFAEGQYVTADDALAGNANNNASYRRITFAANAAFSTTFVAPTVQMQPAILGWQAQDPAVVIENVDFAGDGRFIVGKKITDVGGGTFHYELAVHNLTSDRSGGGFTVTFPAGTTITNPGFKDVNYHSGEPWSGTDWPASINGASISWATTPHAIDPNANALRWGTLYNFWFDATAATESGKTIQLFKPAACPANPFFPVPVSYVLNTAAPFDDPPIVGQLGPTGNELIGFLPLGLNFKFFGMNATVAVVSTNGLVTFTNQGTNPTNVCIPSAAGPNGIIAAYWDDLVIGGGQCRYSTIGTAPNRRFVVSWTNAALASNPASLQSFKLILDETTNVITSTIISSADGGASATRGLERQDGLAGILGSCNQPGSAVAGTSWTYTPFNIVVPTAALTISGSTAPNSTIIIGLNSNALSAPIVLFASLDPGPTSLGSLGSLSLGFTPGLYTVVSDGAGLFQPANPNDFTDFYCGDFQLVVPIGPAGVPPGFTIYLQGGVISSTTVPPPPNALFHLTTLGTINT